MKKLNVFFALLAVLLMVMTGCGRHGDEGVLGDGQTPPVDVIEMTEFSINGVDGIIDENAKTIRVVLPLGADLTTLVATFSAPGTVQVNGIDQVSGFTPNDFTKPVTYSITLDGTTKDYTVTVKIGVLSGKDGSTTVIDTEEGNSGDKNYIYGLETGLTKEKFESDYVQIPNGYRFEYDPDNGILGTGTKVTVIDNATDDVVETYYIVIYGDVNGDGNIDANDAGVIIDYENYLLGIDQTTGLAY